jgi:small subunit ribosomal protein S11
MMAEEPKTPPVDEETPVIEAETATEAVETAEGAPETPVVSETGPADAPARAKRKKNRRTVTSGQIHVLATFNNTIITITDEKGNTLATASAGASGFRGSKKGTAYAAQIAAEKAVSTARQNFGLAKADVFVKGVGMGRDAAIRTLVSQKVQLDNIKDVTGIPHGGVRPRRPKRN